MKEAEIIKNWGELSNFDDSSTHTLDIGDRCGWVREKSTRKLVHYLSTHTFYGSTYKSSTKALKSFGFNVEIKNCDKQDA